MKYVFKNAFFGIYMPIETVDCLPQVKLFFAFNMGNMLLRDMISC